MSSRIVQLLQTVKRPARGIKHNAGRLGRDKNGATVVEFAIVIFPFLAILFAVVEVALVFFAGQVLETAVADSSRRIMTGEVQKAGLTEDQFKQDVCGRLQALFDCQGGIHIDVKKHSASSGGDPNSMFGDANLSQPPYDEENDELDVSDFDFDPGKQGDIVIVRVAYEWPIFVRDFGFNLSTLPNGKRLLMATAAFRNEPYRD